ncbi:MAG: sigma 54-interacting transcriptional regulator, partial [Planctomycetota bacterium]
SASAAMQLKLLRVLQERRFEPVGSTETIEVDARVILASNQPLEKLVADGSFRQDLYYRINVVKIELPPLRERVSDIPLLAEHFLKQHAGELEREISGFSDEAMQALRRYTFPGNVRELANIVERAAVLCRGDRIELADLPPQIASGEDGGMLAALTGGDDPGPYRAIPLADALLEPERKIIMRALEANDWNRQATADALAINRTTLYKKMKHLDIEEPGRRAG